MTAVAYGERGANPADQHSFIVTEELAPTVSLEDFSIDWIKQPPEPALKRALIAEVARMTGTMHRAGSIIATATSATSFCIPTGRFVLAS